MQKTRACLKHTKNQFAEGAAASFQGWEHWEESRFQKYGSYCPGGYKAIARVATKDERATMLGSE